MRRELLEEAFQAANTAGAHMKHFNRAHCAIVLAVGSLALAVAASEVKADDCETLKQVVGLASEGWDERPKLDTLYGMPCKFSHNTLTDVYSLTCERSYDLSVSRDELVRNAEGLSELVAACLQKPPRRQKSSGERHSRFRVDQWWFGDFGGTRRVDVVVEKRESTVPGEGYVPATVGIDIRADDWS